MESYCPHCGEVHRPDLAPALCEQRRRGALATYGRILTREEVCPLGIVAADTADSGAKVPEQEQATPAEKYLASEAKKRRDGRRRGSAVVKPKPSVPGAGIEARLAASEKKLAELRQKQRARTAKWRMHRKDRIPV